MYLFVVVHVVVASHDRLRVRLAVKRVAPRRRCSVSPCAADGAGAALARGPEPLPPGARRARATAAPATRPARASPRERCLTCHTALGQRIAAGQGPARARRVPRLRALPRRAPGPRLRARLLGQGGQGRLRPRPDRLPARGAPRARWPARPATARAQDPGPRPRLARGGANLARTFLGLGTACTSCHADPHGGPVRAAGLRGLPRPGPVEAARALRPRQDGVPADRARTSRWPARPATRAGAGRAAALQGHALRDLRQLPPRSARAAAWARSARRATRTAGWSRIDAGPLRPRARRASRSPAATRRSPARLPSRARPAAA